MKLMIFFIFALFSSKIVAQKPLILPQNAVPAKGYTLCLIPDSTYRKGQISGIIPPMGWEEFILEKVPKHQGWTLELPVFDSILIKIPVDKTTRMANLPDEYGLVDERIVIVAPTLKWVFLKKNKECLSAYPEDCLTMAYVEVPSKYQKEHNLPTGNLNCETLTALGLTCD